MSPSPTGPGFLMRASTCAGRERSGERTCPGLDAVAGVLPSPSTAGPSSAQPEARLEGLRGLRSLKASWPGLPTIHVFVKLKMEACEARTCHLNRRCVDDRDKPGHDGECPGELETVPARDIWLL
jgi:hypothetical protein